MVAEFGNAWGDAAEGDDTLGLVQGAWNTSDRYINKKQKKNPSNKKNKKTD